MFAIYGMSFANDVNINKKNQLLKYIVTFFLQ